MQGDAAGPKSGAPLNPRPSVGLSRHNAALPALNSSGWIQGRNIDLARIRENHGLGITEQRMIQDNKQGEYTAWLSLVAALISVYALLLTSQQDRSQQLAMAALPERLAAHQKAYTIWLNAFHDMRFKNHYEVRQTAKDALKWYTKNNLYLDRNVSRDFAGFLAALLDHANELALSDHEVGIRPSDRNMRRLVAPGESIPRAVGLPPFGQEVTVLNP